VIFDWPHLKDRQTGYGVHLFLALRMAIRILLTAVFLVGHALVPVIKQPKYFKIITLSNYLYDQYLKTHEKLIDSKKAKR